MQLFIWAFLSEIEQPTFICTTILLAMTKGDDKKLNVRKTEIKMG